MLVIIRIRGMVDVPGDLKELLYRLRLRRKYVAVLMKESSENEKILKKIRNYVSYGTINEAILEKLIKHRAISVDKKEVDSKKILEGLGKKNLLEMGIKPFFRLHPPRGGIESKRHAGKGKGVLGENKKINELLERML